MNDDPVLHTTNPTVTLEPYWPGVLRYYAEVIATKGFTGSTMYGPVASFMEQVRYAAANDPEGLQRLIDDFENRADSA